MRPPTWLGSARRVLEKISLAGQRRVFRSKSNGCSGGFLVVFWRGSSGFLEVFQRIFSGGFLVFCFSSTYLFCICVAVASSSSCTLIYSSSIDHIEDGENLQN